MNGIHYSLQLKYNIDCSHARDEMAKQINNSITIHSKCKQSVIEIQSVSVLK